MARPRQICRVWGSWALCPLGGCWLIDEFQKQHGFWDPVLGRDIRQKQRDPGPRRHLSNPKTQAWRGQRRGDSGWTQRPSCLTVAPRQDGGAYGQESWLVWGCRGLGAPPSRFVTLLISGRSFATPKAPSPAVPDREPLLPFHRFRALGTGVPHTDPGVPPHLPPSSSEDQSGNCSGAQGQGAMAPRFPLAEGGWTQRCRQPPPTHAARCPLPHCPAASHRCSDVSV